MGKTLYLECYSGISGDMTVAALLDLGADQEVLEQALKSLPVSGFQTKISRVTKSGIDACDFDVILDQKHENHDHDMKYLHGHHHEEDMHGHHHEGNMHAHCHKEDTHTHHHEGNMHAHCHEEDTHEHHHKEEHTHSHMHHHEHRGMKEITDIIKNSAMTENAKYLALKIFTILAEAESKAHRVPVDQVHFHEVGAIDSIVDIVSVAVCLDALDITEVIVPVLYEGQGTVRCQHGILPIPVPAVANVVSAHHLNLKITQISGELVTPTGAAIVAAIKTKDHLPEDFTVEKVGIGAGKRQYECPGILRAMLIEKNEKISADAADRNLNVDLPGESDSIIKMETNIDDCSGEVLGYVMDCLLKAGARDVYYTPIYMKKNRPAWMLSVLCKEEDLQKMQHIVFKETTTIGIRYTKMERTILPRVERTVSTPWGDAQVKVCTLDGAEQLYPEYESVAQLSRDAQVPFAEIYAYLAGSQIR